MDTSKFELTDEELTEEAEMLYNFNMSIEGIEGLLWQICRKQIRKVLSMLEPVELEALGDEEVFNLGFKTPYKSMSVELFMLEATPHLLIF